MKDDYIYVVVECDTDDRVNLSVSHFSYKTITEANARRAEFARINPDLTFHVLHVFKG